MLVLAFHLSSALTLALITASRLLNGASLGCRSMCSRHKCRDFAPGNTSRSHYGTRKSVWCDKRFTPVAKRSFCFFFSLMFCSSSFFLGSTAKQKMDFSSDAHQASEKHTNTSKHSLHINDHSWASNLEPSRFETKSIK